MHRARGLHRLDVLQQPSMGLFCAARSAAVTIHQRLFRRKVRANATNRGDARKRAASRPAANSRPVRPWRRAPGAARQRAIPMLCASPTRWRSAGPSVFTASGLGEPRAIYRPRPLRMHRRVGRVDGASVVSPSDRARYRRSPAEPITVLRSVPPRRRSGDWPPARVRRFGQARENQRELVAADTAAVSPSRQRAQYLGRGLQRAVACVVTVRVVDGLERQIADSSASHRRTTRRQQRLAQPVEKSVRLAVR